MEPEREFFSVFVLSAILLSKLIVEGTLIRELFLKEFQCQLPTRPPGHFVQTCHQQAVIEQTFLFQLQCTSKLKHKQCSPGERNNWQLNRRNPIQTRNNVVPENKQLSTKQTQSNPNTK